MTKHSALNSARQKHRTNSKDMTAKVLAFSNKGRQLGQQLVSLMDGNSFVLLPKGTDLSEICREAFEKREAIIFIGAAGIAVRSVAPYVKDKLTDPPVIVIDESGRHVIPVLSGHVGGANELALKIAAVIGAEPVLTTATDVSGAFSVDLFAGENGLRILNREGIAKVSSSALEGKAVTICIKDYPPQDKVDVLITDEYGSMNSGAFKDIASIILCPKKYAVGIGCRKGKSFEEMKDFAESVLADHGIDAADIGAVATIDIKKDEPALIRLSEYWRVPLITFEASVLAKVQGTFTASERVLEAVGVDNVCERAAAAAAGPGSEMIVPKTAYNGMTLAVSKRIH